MGETKDAALAAGMQVRREMFGPGGAEERYAHTTDFNRPFEDMVTRYCFGDTWTRAGLDRKTRSLITLLHTAVYAGVPCGVEAFNAAAEILARHSESKP